MKISTSTPKPVQNPEAVQTGADWSPAKLEQNNSSVSPDLQKMSYRDKFRAKVKTVLRNVRDLDIEEYDQQQRKTNEDGSSLGADSSHSMFTGSALGVEDDPVDATNIVKFARKAFLILGLQILVATIWVSCVCPNDELFDQFYTDSETFILIASLALLVIFGSLYYSKKVFGSYKTHIAISSALTLSLGYLFGAMALLISYKTMIASFLMSLSFIAGLVVYCKVTADGYFNTKRSIMSGCFFLMVTTACLYLWTDCGAWTVFLLYLVSNIFGIALVFKIQLAAENEGSRLLMKHYVFFAMLLYIDFVKTVAQTAIHTLNYKAKAPQEPTAKDLPPETHLNLFAFTSEPESKCL